MSLCVLGVSCIFASNLKTNNMESEELRAAIKKDCEEIYYTEGNTKAITRDVARGLREAVEQMRKEGVRVITNGVTVDITVPTAVITYNGRKDGSVTIRGIRIKV